MADENTENLSETQDDDKDESKGTEDSDDVTADEEALDTAAKDAEREAERERLAQEITEKLKREFEEKANQEKLAAQEEERTRALLNSFGTTVREIRQNLKGIKFYDADGQEQYLTDEALEAMVIQPLAKYNQTGERAQSLKVLTALSQAALNSLPESVREDFAAKATGKPFDQWLEEYAETRAADTAYAKRLAKEYEAKVKAAEARGFKKGKESPASPPSVSGEKTPPKGNIDYSSAGSLARAYNEGRIDQKTFLEHWKKLGD